jgi:prepilin-type N-terminal cleavage/methylation domain-containing protein
MNKKGFTLIELLVVIAIIGLLSSVVLASLNNARNKGGNSSIKADMNSLRSQAALTYDNANGVYTNICSDSTIQRDAVVIQTASGATNANNYTIGNAGSANTVTCHSSANGWALEAPLRVAEGSNTFWCVDYNGKSTGENGTQLTANTVACP